MPVVRQHCSQEPGNCRTLAADRAPVASRLACCLIGLQLAACAGVSPQSAPQPDLRLPTAWSLPLGAATPAGPVTPLAQWWLRFDDPLLSALIDEALRANPSVRSASAALAQSRALADVQRAGLAPALAGSASAQRSVSGKGGAATSNMFRAGLDASWEPDLFGAQHAGLTAATAETQASAAKLGDMQVSVTAEVALDYMQLRGLQTRLDIARANLAAQLETLQLTQWRTQAGLTTSLELEQARGAAEQTRAQIPLLTAAAAQIESGIAVLTGNAPTALHERLKQTSREPTAPEDLVLDIPAETLRQRPDLRAAEARINAAVARVTQADAARYPGFQLSGSVGMNALTIGSLTHASSLMSSMLAGASATLFDAGAATARVRAQQASLEQAHAAYELTLLTALKEVEDGLIALRSDNERQQSLQLAAEAAHNAALLARQRYASGLIDFQTVLETQRTALTTEDNLASTASAINADHVRLYKALGGGWEPRDANLPAALRLPP